MFEQCYSDAGPWMFFEQTMDDWPMSTKTPLWEGKRKCYAARKGDNWSNIDWSTAYLSWDKIRGIRRKIFWDVKDMCLEALPLALHPRLGANSPFRVLDRELMQLVLTRACHA